MFFHRRHARSRSDVVAPMPLEADSPVLGIAGRRMILPTAAAMSIT